MKDKTKPKGDQPDFTEEELECTNAFFDKLGKENKDKDKKVSDNKNKVTGK